MTKPLWKMLAFGTTRTLFWLQSFTTNGATMMLRETPLKTSRALWVILKFLIIPEQVNSQSQLLERGTQAKVIVPALLHDLVHLREKAGWRDEKTDIYSKFYLCCSVCGSDQQWDRKCEEKQRWRGLQRAFLKLESTVFLQWTFICRYTVST